MRNITKVTKWTKGSWYRSPMDASLVNAPCLHNIMAFKGYNFNKKSDGDFNFELFKMLLLYYGEPIAKLIPIYYIN